MMTFKKTWKKGVTLGKRLADMNGWEIADYFGCHYSGDTNPIPHGGYWYSIEDWQEYGYASCVQVDFIHGGYGDEAMFYVEPGTINRIDNQERMRQAYACIGAEPDGVENKYRNSVHIQIEACKSYIGIEYADTQYSFTEKQIEEDEATIWETIASELHFLQPPLWPSILLTAGDTEYHYNLTDQDDRLILSDMLDDQGFSDLADMLREQAPVIPRIHSQVPHYRHYWYYLDKQQSALNREGIFLKLVSG